MEGRSGDRVEAAPFHDSRVGQGQVVGPEVVRHGPRATAAHPLAPAEKESATEYHHYEDDDEQSSRVSICISYLFVYVGADIMASKRLLIRHACRERNCD